jgi:hypothetical protein
MSRWRMSLRTDRGCGGGRSWVVGCLTAGFSMPGRGRWEGFVKLSLSLLGLGLGVATLGGCSRPGECLTSFQGGCVPLPANAVTESPPAPSPAVISPVAVTPAVVSPGVAPVSATPAVVSRGDPSAFADVDDRQCRSYGLTFGSRDYADCRIRLSAQHRGLDPNLGSAATGPGSR